MMRPVLAYDEEINAARRDLESNEGGFRKSIRVARPEAIFAAGERNDTVRHDQRKNGSHYHQRALTWSIRKR